MGQLHIGVPFHALAAKLEIRGVLNAVVIIVVDGMPRFSNATVSCTLHKVQEPQPPRAAMATSTSFAISSISASVAGLE